MTFREEKGYFSGNYHYITVSEAQHSCVAGEAMEDVATGLFSMACAQSTFLEHPEPAFSQPHTFPHQPLFRKIPWTSLVGAFSESMCFSSR